MDVGAVSITNIDDETAGFTVGIPDGNTSESGGTATFTVKLNSQPTADVTIAVSSDDTGEGTVSPSSLTFTSSNWNASQTVTVTGVNDELADGNQSFNIVLAAATSSDSDYNGLNPADVTLYNIDDESVGFIINPTSGTTTEAGGLFVFSFCLNSPPDSDVIVPIASSDITEGTVSLSSLTFTTSNWNTPQEVTVTGLNDDISDGNQNYSIVIGQASSDDTEYNGENPTNISLANIVSVPEAVAGQDTTVSTGSTVILDGSKSSTGDGDKIDYSWSFLSVPVGSSASLSDPLIVNPTFTADVVGSYIIQLVIMDEADITATNSITIIAENKWIGNRFFGARQEGSTRPSIFIDSSGDILAVANNVTINDNNEVEVRMLQAIKYDRSGNVLWKNTYGPSLAISNAAIDNQDNLVVVGSNRLIKISNNGDSIFNNSILGEEGTTSNQINVVGVAIDASDNIYITGGEEAPIFGDVVKGSWDVYIAKFDKDGTYLNSTSLGSPGFEDPTSIDVDSSGDIYVTGYTNMYITYDSPIFGDVDAFLVKLNSQLELDWGKQWGTSGSDYAWDVKVDSEGNPIVLHMINFSNLLKKMSSGGDQIWEGSVQMNGSQDAELAIGIDGSIYSFDGSPYKIRTQKISKDGSNVLWSSDWDVEGHDKGSDIAVNSKNEVFVIGTTPGELNRDYGFYENDAVIIKYDENGIEQ